MRNSISSIELLSILVIFIMVMYILVYSLKPSPVPINWCEGIAANNEHVQVTACSCDKDGSECHVTIKR